MRKLYSNPYEVDEVYVKPTEWSVKYHHPDCGYAGSEANTTRSEAEEEGYKPASCCLDGLQTTSERVTLTQEAHKKLYDEADGWEERRDIASNIINDALTEGERPDEYVDLADVAVEHDHGTVENNVSRNEPRGLLAKIRSFF